eukprot:COSAG03_NODE_1574_length_3852_cov_26.310152_3_plen_123_part_00
MCANARGQHDERHRPATDHHLVVLVMEPLLQGGVAARLVSRRGGRCWGVIRRVGLWRDALQAEREGELQQHNAGTTGGHPATFSLPTLPSSPPPLLYSPLLSSPLLSLSLALSLCLCLAVTL